MELILFIYMLVIVVVTGYVLLTREKDVDAATTAAADAATTAAAADVAITSADAARLVEWAEDGHMPAVHAADAAAAADADAVLPGEEEDKWENLAEDWEFPEIGKNDHDDWMVGDCKYNRALRGCGRRGKGKQKGGKHINKKKLRRADTKAHLSLA